MRPLPPALRARDHVETFCDEDQPACGRCRRARRHAGAGRPTHRDPLLCRDGRRGIHLHPSLSGDRHDRLDRRGRRLPAVRQQCPTACRGRPRRADRPRPGRYLAGRECGPPRFRGCDRHVCQRHAADQYETARLGAAGQLHGPRLRHRSALRAQPRRPDPGRLAPEPHGDVLELAGRLQVREARLGDGRHADRGRADVRRPCRASGGGVAGPGLVAASRLHWLRVREPHHGPGRSLRQPQSRGGALRCLRSGRAGRRARPGTGPGPGERRRQRAGHLTRLHVVPRRRRLPPGDDPPRPWVPRHAAG